MSMNASQNDGRLSKLSKDQSDLLLRLLLERKRERSEAISASPRREGAPEKPPASWAQQRLWFIDQLENGAAGYQISVFARLRGSLDTVALGRALDALVHRHDVLRTTFVLEEGRVWQRVRKEAHLPLETVDLRDRDDQGQRSVLARLRSEAAHSRFDLEVGPLIRGRLVCLGSEDHVLVITLHHIIGDGWSMGVLFAELGEFYGAFLQGRSPRVPALPLQYGDYALWQQGEACANTMQRDIDYWRRCLDGAPAELALPFDHPRPTVQTYRGKSFTFALQHDLATDLRALAGRSGTTLFMVLHAGWAILLSRLSGQEDVVSGTPIANRQRTEVEGLIGFFANTLALRVQVKADSTVEEFLRQVKAVALGAYAHQNVPFERVVETARPDRSMSRNPVFQVMMALQNAPRHRLRLPGLAVSLEEGEDEPALFDLFISLEERDETIIGSVNYSEDLFERETVARWLACFEVLLKGLTRTPSSRIGELPIMPDSERRKIVEEFNATGEHCYSARAIHELFEEQVRRTPNAVAVEEGERRFTYAQVNAQANQLARYLLSRRIGPGQVVGICAGRSPEMVAGLLGILKAGGAYLPLDPDYPLARMAQMLEDAQPSAILAPRVLAQALSTNAGQVIVLDEVLERVSGGLEGNVAANVSGSRSESLVYVIYTSGSTGRPKGTMMRHRSAVNLIEWHRRTLGRDRGDRVLQFAALSFDVAFQEIFSTLCMGGTLVLLDEWVRRDARALRELLVQRSIDRLFVPPLMLQSLAGCGKTASMPRNLQDVITAGEQLRVTPEIRDFFRRQPGCRLHNHYGPTETHVVTALTLAGDPGSWPDLPPIGRPIDNTQVYVLDSRMQPVPIGVAGEMYLGGANVALGYLDRPALTEERFLPDPFNTDSQARLYRTGDLGRWMADGNLEYLGRNDDQVKIRGFRIEPAEIETQLARHEAVKEAAVVAREETQGEKRLVAYVTTRDGNALGAEELRGHLKVMLPEYMVPSAFVVLEKLPLTPSGKLDRRALPAPDSGAHASEEYEPPCGEVEQFLAEVWRELLHLERVGRNDNFFELGGHSLLIVQMLERLRRARMRAEVRQVYESRSLAALALVVGHGPAMRSEVPPNGIPSDCESITPPMLTLLNLQPEEIARIVDSVPGGARNIQDIYPLAPLQSGMLFHHLLDPKAADPYLRSMWFSVSSRDRLERLIAALQATINRHDALRTSVHWEDLPHPVQAVWRKVTLPVEQMVLGTPEGRPPRIADWRWPDRRLDLRRAPLFRLRVAADRKGASWHVLLQIHHLICDAESLETLFSEMADHVKGRSEDLPVALPYRDHVFQAIRSAELSSAEQFFRDRLSGIREPTAPFGVQHVHGDGADLEVARAELEQRLASRLRAQARRLAVSTATMFHAVWALVVARTSGQDEALFGTVLLGRMEGETDMDRTIGMFINTLPMHLALAGVSARELIEQTQRGLTGLLEHEQTALAVVQRCSGISSSLPLFSTLLNYRHYSARRNSSIENALGLKWIETEGGTNYPLAASVEESSEGIAIEIEASKPIDAGRVLAYTMTAIESLVEALERAPHTSASTLAVLPAREREEILERFNATEAGYPTDKLVHHLFEEQVRRTPEVVAVESNHRSLTYAEVNDRANRLAAHLRSLGVGPDRPVGVYLERGVEMIIALLGVLKSGGAYVPLDPANPARRLEYLLQDAAPTVVVTQDSFKSKLGGWCSTLVALDGERSDIAEQGNGDLAVAPSVSVPEQLAYIIYTSGSTGEPKGVMVEHRSVAMLWHGLEALFSDLPQCQRIALNAPISFDGSVKQLVQLLSGRTLVVVPECLRRDAPMLLQFLARMRIEAIDCTRQVHKIPAADAAETVIPA